MVKAYETNNALGIKTYFLSSMDETKDFITKITIKVDGEIVYNLNLHPTKPTLQKNPIFKFKTKNKEVTSLFIRQVTNKNEVITSSFLIENNSESLNIKLLERTSKIENKTNKIDIWQTENINEAVQLVYGKKRKIEKSIDYYVPTCVNYVLHLNINAEVNMQSILVFKEEKAFHSTKIQKTPVMFLTLNPKLVKHQYFRINFKGGSAKVFIVGEDINGILYKTEKTFTVAHCEDV